MPGPRADNPPQHAEPVRAPVAAERPHGEPEWFRSGSMGTAAPQHDQRPVPQKRGQLISWVAMKGGVGKSTVSVLAAAVLAEVMPNKRVLLVDGNPAQSSQQTILEMRQSSLSIRDLAAGPFSVTRLQEVITRVPNTQLDVLLGPTQRRDDNPLQITPELYGKAIEAALPMYDYVILDTPVAQLMGREPIMERVVLPQSDQIVVVVNPNNETIRNNRDWLMIVTSPMASPGGANFDRSRVRVLVNRFQDDVGWSIEGIRGMFPEYRWLGVIPEDVAIKRAENDARLHLDSAVVRDEMLTVLSDLIGDSTLLPEPTKTHRSLMNRLRAKVTGNG